MLVNNLVYVKFNFLFVNKKRITRISINREWYCCIRNRKKTKLRLNLGDLMCRFSCLLTPVEYCKHKHFPFMNILIFIHERFRMFCLWKKKNPAYIVYCSLPANMLKTEWKKNDYTKRSVRTKLAYSRRLRGFLSVSAKKKTLNRLYCWLEQNEPRTCRYIFRYFFLSEPLLKTAGQPSNLGEIAVLLESPEFSCLPRNRAWGYRFVKFSDEF